jgi:hypothetical protein
VGNGLRTQARRALLRQVAPTYHCASASQKQQILEDFVGATGYARKYARWLLNHVEEVFVPPTALRRQYGPEVEEALVLVWKTLTPGSTDTCSPNLPQAAEALSSRTGRRTRGSFPAAPASSLREAGQLARSPRAVSSPSAAHPSSTENSHGLTMQRAVREYLQAHREVGHRPKTLEWHHMALCHLQQYVLTECHLLLVSQISEATICSWLAFLAQTPTTRGSRRSASTIETYARSARAFFSWLVEREALSCSPMSERAFPRTTGPLPRFVSSATFDRVMRGGFSQTAKAPGAKYLAARDQALLWVLFDTGITVSELCALRLISTNTQACCG